MRIQQVSRLTRMRFGFTGLLPVDKNVKHVKVSYVPLIRERHFSFPAFRQVVTSGLARLPVPTVCAALQEIEQSLTKICWSMLPDVVFCPVLAMKLHGRILMGVAI